MSREISRATKMDKVIVLRATQDDKSALKLAAMKQGLDCSGFIRKLLIEHKVLDPMGKDDSKELLN